MGCNNYRNGGAAEILTSFGLMLASGFGALSRLLYGVCGPRRDGGGCYCNRDGGYTRRDNVFTHRDGGYMRQQENEWRQYGGWRDPR